MLEPLNSHRRIYAQAGVRSHQDSVQRRWLYSLPSVLWLPTPCSSCLACCRAQSCLISEGSRVLADNEASCSSFTHSKLSPTAGLGEESLSKIPPHEDVCGTCRTLEVLFPLYLRLATAAKVSGIARAAYEWERGVSHREEPPTSSPGAQSKLLTSVLQLTCRTLSLGPITSSNFTQAQKSADSL